MKHVPANSTFLRLMPLVLVMFVAPMSFAEQGIVTLQKGETLYAISVKYGVPVAVLLRINGIDEEDVTKLKEGTQIRIPSYHVVQKGDTLYGIARDQGILLADLASYNEIAADTRIKVGQKVYFPTEKDGSTHPSPLWPHAGTVESLPGKLPGVVIHGSGGDQVVSVSSGRVKWVGPYASFGRVVLVKTSGDYIYGYGGMGEILVSVGDKVGVGMDIGRLAAGTLNGSARVFFFIHDQDLQPVDPYSAPRK